MKVYYLIVHAIIISISERKVTEDYLIYNIDGDQSIRSLPLFKNESVYPISSFPHDLFSAYSIDEKKNHLQEKSSEIPARSRFFLSVMIFWFFCI